MTRTLIAFIAVVTARFLFLSSESMIIRGENILLAAVLLFFFIILFHQVSLKMKKESLPFLFFYGILSFSLAFFALSLVGLLGIDLHSSLPIALTLTAGAGAGEAIFSLVESLRMESSSQYTDRGWTSFDERVLASNSSETEVDQGLNRDSTSEGEERRRAASSHRCPFRADEVIGGDSIEFIEQRLIRALSPEKQVDPFELDECRRKAEDLFEVKVSIIRQMAPLHPEGDWEGRGARALENSRARHSETSLEKLFAIKDSLAEKGVKSEHFLNLTYKVPVNQNLDRQSQSLLPLLGFRFLKKDPKGPGANPSLGETRNLHSQPDQTPSRASFFTARKMLFAAILSICALSSKKILIYNEEMIVALCFIGFLLFSRKSLGKTFQMTLDERIKAIQEELQQFPNPNEVVPTESNEEERLLRTSLGICGTVIESLPMARCAPKCEKTLQAFLCRNLNLKSATLPNATSSRRIRLQDDLVAAFHFSVNERFVPGSTSKVSLVELIREGLAVFKMVRVESSLKKK